MPASLLGGTRYGRVWGLAAICLAGIGLGAALVFISLPTVLMVFLVVAGVVGSVHFSVAQAVESLSLRLLAGVGSWAGRAGLAVLAICGYAASVGLGVLLLLLLVAATSPPAVGWLRPSAWEWSLRGGPSDLGSLSDEELCREWQRSFEAVRDSKDGEDLQAAVEARRRCLDELERRKPDAFAQWLESMPTAAADPSVYYLGAGDREPPEPE
ncbi:hypothetical protein ACIBL3_46010 [Kribbella sp. NPDC050124]|uniref:hypothetical protein n=1 Tax=Kribbella sp. NPDC050124 TaxID=3364114 RepID=UPI0037A3EE21